MKAKDRVETILPAILLSTLTLGCSEATSTPPPECPKPAPADGCWERLRPLGSGGFPAEPGSNDEPKWEPGRFPASPYSAIAAREGG